MMRLSAFIFVSVFFTLISLKVKSVEGPVSVSQSAPNSVLSGEDFIVRLTIKKEGTESFAKIQQQLPEGFSAIVILSANAHFSFEESTVKFIWDKLPETNEFSVSYKVTIDPDVYGVMKIGGVFAFVKNEDRVLIKIDTIEINVEPAEELTAEKAIEVKEIEGVEKIEESVGKEAIEEKVAEEETIVEEEILVEEVPVEEVIVEEVIVEASTKPAQKTALAPVKTAPNSFIFKIQIAAAYRKIDITFLSNKYNIPDQVSKEVHNNMYKYTVGSFETYSQAKLYLNKVLNSFGVNGAFITAYQGELRIPVNQTFK